jgi:hypothetical protein
VAKGEFVNTSKLRLFFLLLVGLYCLIPATLVADDYERARSLLLDAKERVDSLSDYTLTIRSQERVGGKLLPEATMLVKFKRPFCLYLKNLTGKHVNREIIYVKGRYNNKMIVSPGGIFGGLTARISPDSVLTKRESRHTITEAGLPNIMERMISILQEDGKTAACRPTVTCPGDGYCSSKKVVRIRIVNSSYAPKTELALDAQTLYPAEIVSYDTDGSLLESYRYQDMKANVGLTDTDFDPENPAYHF